MSAMMVLVYLAIVSAYAAIAAIFLGAFLCMFALWCLDEGSALWEYVSELILASLNSVVGLLVVACVAMIFAYVVR